MSLYKLSEKPKSTYELYESQLTKESSSFMRIVLKKAMFKLKAGIPHKKVENWVVNLETLYRKKL